MITFLEYSLVVSLIAVGVWQFIWMVMLDRWIQKWDQKAESDRLFTELAWQAELTEGDKDGEI